jgi:galactokinase
MDQMASVHGRAGHVLFLDTRAMSIEAVPFDLAAHGLALLVIDSRAPHALVDGEYAERRASCEKGRRRSAWQRCAMSTWSDSTTLWRG